MFIDMGKYFSRCDYNRFKLIIIFYFEDYLRFFFFCYAPEEGDDVIAESIYKSPDVERRRRKGGQIEEGRERASLFLHVSRAVNHYNSKDGAFLS